MTLWEKDFETISLEKNESWVTVWLNRPDVKNALSENMTFELIKALSFIAKNKMIRGVALRGVNGCFCAGADLKEFERNFSINNRKDVSLVSFFINKGKRIKIMLVEY